jgi:hypothetical protein
MLRSACIVGYFLILVPIWAFRVATGASRFGRRFHRKVSAWDLPERTL